MKKYIKKNHLEVHMMKIYNIDIMKYLKFYQKNKQNKKETIDHIR